jgi:hypothetical protein
MTEESTCGEQQKKADIFLTSKRKNLRIGHRHLTPSTHSIKRGLAGAFKRIAPEVI